MSTSETSNRTEHEDLIKEVDRREKIVKNYVAIVNPSNKEPMLQLRTHGDCTVADPRACLDHYTVAARRVCCLFVHISLPYFHAMVLSGLLCNGTRLVLCDTTPLKNNRDPLYKCVHARNKTTAKEMATTVDGLLSRARKRTIEGQCQVGTDILQIPYNFTQYTNKNKKHNRSGFHGQTMKESEWIKSIQKRAAQYECSRTEHNRSLAKVENRSHLRCSSQKRKPQKDEFAFETVLVVEADWGLPTGGGGDWVAGG